MSNTSKILSRYIFPSVFIIASIALLFIGFNISNKTKTYSKTVAEIIDITSEYDPAEEGLVMHTFVKYNIDGKEYTYELHSYKSSYEIGTKVNILYSPSNPYDILEDSKMGVYISFISSAICMVIGIVFLTKGFKEAKLEKENSYE